MCVELAEGTKTEHSMEAEYRRGFKDQPPIGGGRVVIMRMFIAWLDEGCARVRGRGECAAYPAHDSAEEWGLEELFRAAGVAPQGLDVANITTDRGVTPDARS